MSDHVGSNGAPHSGEREIAGKWLILGIALFAVAVTGTLFVYWKLHRGPFLAYQRAIAERYEGSRPLVEGGRHKMHRGGPAVLRVVMEVEFDPNADENERTVDGIVDQLVELGRERLDTFDQYDRFEAHLFLQERERQLHEHTVEVELESGRRKHVDHDPRIRISP